MEMISIEQHEVLEEKLINYILNLDFIEAEVKQKLKEDSSNKEKLIIEVLFDEDGQLSEDLSSITFGHEKVISSPRKRDDSDCLLGYQSFDNGLEFLGILCGGNWEHPVFFIVYHDGQMVRGYIPENGNVYNPYTMEAFGNNEEEDLLWLTDNVSDEYSEKSGFKLNMLKSNDIDFNWEKIKEDILKMVEI